MIPASPGTLGNFDMGIGRRDFLKAFGATIAAHATSPLQAVVLGGETYVNQSLGLAFRQPPGWEVVSLKDFPAIRHAQELEDNEISKELLSGSDPFVVMSRPGPDEIGASMTAYAEAFRFEGGETLDRVPHLLQPVLARALGEYTLVGTPRRFSISGVDSIEFFARFPFRTTGQTLPARQRSVVSVRAGAVFTFNAFDYPERGVDAQTDFDTLLGSLTYA